MSVLRDTPQLFSPEEYLATEEDRDIRHEFLNGEVYAMAGTTVDHHRIAGNIFGALHSHLHGKTCEAFMNDMKAHIELAHGEWFYYPDVMVNCDPSGQKKLYCDTPAVIVEVLSPGTKRIDQQEKLLACQAIPALHTYVVVAQNRREVAVFRRAAGWAKETPPADGALVIPELEFSLPLDAIYARAGI